MDKVELYIKVKEQYEEKYPGHINALKMWKDGRSSHFKLEMSHYVKYLIKGKVLVVGCGPGHQVFGLNEFGFEGHGCDVSSFAISNAFVPNCKVSDIRKLCYEDKEFLNVTVFDVLEHLPFDFLNEALKECERVTEKIILFRIPFSAKEGTLSTLGLEDGLKYPTGPTVWQHYVNQNTQWWESQFFVVFLKEEWKYTYIKDSIFGGSSDWHLYRFERR